MATDYEKSVDFVHNHPAIFALCHQAVDSVLDQFDLPATNRLDVLYLFVKSSSVIIKKSLKEEMHTRPDLFKEMDRLAGEIAKSFMKLSKIEEEKEIAEMKGDWDA